MIQMSPLLTGFSNAFVFIFLIHKQWYYIQNSYFVVLFTHVIFSKLIVWSYKWTIRLLKMEAFIDIFKWSFCLTNCFCFLFFDNVFEFLFSVSYFRSNFLCYQYLISNNIFCAISSWHGDQLGIANINICSRFFFFNRDSLHARLNSHYKAWSYKEKKAQKDYRLQKICLERT